MVDLNDKSKQHETVDKKSSGDTPFGYGHEDVGDDFNALLNVFGIDGLSAKLKQKAMRIVRR